MSTHNPTYLGKVSGFRHGRQHIFAPLAVLHVANFLHQLGNDALRTGPGEVKVFSEVGECREPQLQYLQCRVYSRVGTLSLTIEHVPTLAQPHPVLKFDT